MISRICFGRVGTGCRWAPSTSKSRRRPGPLEPGRSADNPVKGWYGLKNGLRGRFANYVPPVMEILGLAQVEHNAKNNRMKGK
jgi:hypothetical protein